MELENAIQWIKYAAGLGGGLVSTLIGGWDMGLKVLVLFVVLDYITGVAAAFREKTLDSNVGLWGILKKILLFVPVALGFWLDQMVGTDILRNLAIWFYIANEGLSILENLGRCEVLVPPTIVDALQQLKKRSESTPESSDANG